MTTQIIPADVSRESKGVGSRRGPEIKLEHILAPIDFSPASKRGVAFAAGVADRFHARMRLLYAVEPPSLPQWGYTHVPLQEAKLQREAREKLRHLTRECRLPDELVEQTEVRLGSASSTICEMAREAQVDLIIMPAHRHTALGRFFLGSVTQRVVRCAPCPVLVIRDRTLKTQEGHKGFDIKRIVVPTDFSDASKKAFPYAAALARKFGATITVVHVVPTHLALSLTQLGVMLEEKRLIERARKELPLFRAAELDPHVHVSTLVLTGGPAYGICQTADSEAADLIVMATHGHTALQRFVVGSVTEHVLREAPCPVLVVREAEREFV